jgi:hypothetical protein
MKLFRYRPLVLRDLEDLCDNMPFVADPYDFNDPFECKPSIENDIEFDALQKLCWEMHKKNEDEVKATQRLQEIDYFSTNPDIEDAIGYKMSEYTYDISNLLKNVMMRYGVLSLSESCDNILMWSHYANNHKGMCIGYNVNSDCAEHIQPVEYGKYCKIKTSLVYNYIFDSKTNYEKDIINKYFFTKAKDWEYEKEWRMLILGKKKEHAQTELRLSSVIFGLRSEHYAIASIVKLMRKPKSTVRFYQMNKVGGELKLSCHELDSGFYEGFFPRENIHDMFSKIIAP